MRREREREGEGEGEREGGRERWKWIIIFNSFPSVSAVAPALPSSTEPPKIVANHVDVSSAHLTTPTSMSQDRVPAYSKETKHVPVATPTSTKEQKTSSNTSPKDQVATPTSGSKDYLATPTSGNLLFF